MKIVHIFSAANSVLISYIDFIENYFNNYDNIFMTDLKIDDLKNIKSEKINRIKHMNINDLLDADKIFFHYLPSEKFFFKYFFNHQSLFSKSFWVIWGGDFYNLYYSNFSIKKYIKKMCRKFFLKKIPVIISLVEGDYLLAKNYFNLSSKNFNLFYPNAIDYDFLSNIKAEKIIDKDYVSILIGNSADPSNNHNEILTLLSNFKNENVRIICPLSYGNKEYAEKIIDIGHKIFKNKFIPIREFLNIEEYSKILASIDIGIMNHKRQQGLGNILALLFLGKKVYIRNDSSSFQYFEKIGVEIYDTLNISKEKFEMFVRIDKNVKNNTSIIKENYSINKCIELWDEVFKL